jgi:tetratricopeptide (TPR) repeat protein
MKQTISIIAFFFCIYQSGAQNMEDARRNFYYQRYESAKKILHSILLQNNDAADEAVYLLGEVYLKQKHIDSAYMVMELAINKVNERNISYNEAPLTAVGWAHVLLDSGNTADARKMMEAVLQAARYKNIPALLAAAKANIDSKNGDVQWALELLEKAQKKDKKNASVYLLKGDACRKIADGGNAVLNYAEALRKNPSLAETKYKEGLIYKTQNNEEVFLERFTEAYAVDSAYAPALYQLYAYYFFKDVNKAAYYLSAYLRHADPATEHLYMIADLDFVSKKYTAAIATAEKIISAEGMKTQPRIYKLMAYSMAATGDSLTALEKMTDYFSKQDTAEIVPKDFALMAKLQLNDSSGRAAAATWYEKAIAAETDVNEKTGNMMILADIEKELKNYHKEAYWRGEIFKNKPGVTNLDIYKWGTALYAAANYAAADSVFSIYEEKYPAQVYGYLWRAKSNALIDTTMTMGLAVPHYQKLIEVAEADSLKNKVILLNAYGYLGTYEANIKKDYQASLEYFNKILALDPENEDALKFTVTLKKWLNSAAASN